MMTLSLESAFNTVMLQHILGWLHALHLHRVALRTQRVIEPCGEVHSLIIPAARRSLMNLPIASTLSWGGGHRFMIQLFELALSLISCRGPLSSGNSHSNNSSKTSFTMIQTSNKLYAWSDSQDWYTYRSIQFNSSRKCFVHRWAAENPSFSANISDEWTSSTC